MKKSLRIVLTLCLMLVLVLSMTACKDNTENPQGSNGTAEIPQGYTVFDNGAISFAYPDTWSKTDGSVAQLMNPTGSGNNITVAYEEKSDIYKNMTVDSFNTLLEPAFEAVGMSVSNVKIEQRKNALDITVPTISYTASMLSVTMKQTMFVIDSGNKNYIVTVTETTADSELVNNVFNTLNRK